MKKIKKLFSNYLFNILLVFSLTIFVLWFSLKDNFDEIVLLIKNIDHTYLLLLVIVVLAIQFFIGMALTLLTKISNPHYKLIHGIQNGLVASFFHGVTPGSSGGQVAQVYIFKKQNVDISDAASVLWMDFIIYQSTMVVVVFVLLITKLSYFMAYFSNLLILVILGFIISSGIIVSLWALVKFDKIYHFITTKGIEICHRLHLINDKQNTIDTLNKQLKRFDNETKKLKANKIVIIEVIICNIIRLLLYYSIPFICLKALGIDIKAIELVKVMAMSSYISMINCFIPIPGASGGTEATYVIMFSKIFGKVAASSSMLLWRFMSYYFVMIIGGLTFLYVKIFSSKK